MAHGRPLVRARDKLWLFKLLRFRESCLDLSNIMQNSPNDSVKLSLAHFLICKITGTLKGVPNVIIHGLAAPNSLRCLFAITTSGCEVQDAACLTDLCHSEAVDPSTAF